jgi:two-component sensor histidine kinase
MQFSDRRSMWRWIIIIASFIIVIAISTGAYFFSQSLRNEERQKMDLWVMSYKIINSADNDVDITLPNEIISSNTTIPIIMVANGKITNASNIDSEIQSDPVKLQSYYQKLKQENEPIEIQYLGKPQYIYYGNSSLLNKLIYYPAFLLLVILLFALVVYNFYRSTKISTQNKLWAGMAKETAHQIGTPLSSLVGWLEIMKADNVDEVTVTEIEKDIIRLQTIADRFSKIGSEPLLETRDIIAETRQSYDYLQSRFSKQIKFSFKAPKHAVFASFNPILHSWTIENLVKNAIDAMKGRGKLDIHIEEDARFIRIRISDSGKGIPKSQFRKVFEPGFTTKKRGWGLGLSLTKRIVEEYHKGRIKVLNSEVGKGTTMQASFKKI